jgi:hypothetical protein
MKHEPCDVDSQQRVVVDVDNDGRPDLVRVFEQGREVCRAIDINMDGVVDVYVYYDAQGQTRRRESGFDRDSRPDEIQIYAGGVLIRKERETNNDEKIDTWDYYAGGRLMREERDATGDGYVDQWWTFNRPGKPKCAVVMVDGDGDGQPDQASAIDLCAGDANAASALPPAPAPAPAPATGPVAPPAPAASPAPVPGMPGGAR